jgi:hypothetical protein
MTMSSNSINELCRLFCTIREGECSAADMAQLEQLAREDAEVRELYVRFVVMCSVLRYRHVSARSVNAQAKSPPPIAPVESLGLLGTTIHSTIGYLSSGWPVAYLVATVIFGLGLFIGSVVHVSPPEQVAEQTMSPAARQQPASVPSRQFVGRITGMVGCQWTDPNTAVPGPVAVPLGHEYALASGLMEITYDTGARVILQGPCTYQVESDAGGFLSVGKLTVRVEKGEEVRSTEYEVRRGRKSNRAENQKSEIRNHNLFAIRTPTATVTDLGTEFGVEVDQRGATTSHVFRGSVELQAVSADGKTQGVAHILLENESACVTKTLPAQDAGPQMAVTRISARPLGFVRDFPRQTMKTLNLVDLMLSDGLSDPCNRWIDPTTGQVTDTHPKLAMGQTDYLTGDGKYHRAGSASLIDGVFIPDGSRGPVQVDSAGHAFAEFPSTANHTSDYLWAYTAISGNPPLAERFRLRRFDYAMPGHSLLFMQSNVAITFDLDSVRRANANHKLLRFRAAAGKCEPKPEVEDVGLADFWVLVDGQKRFSRREISSRNGDFSVVIPIGENERFLTLASTDAGNGICGDWIMFGDPRFDLAPASPSASSLLTKGTGSELTDTHAAQDSSGEVPVPLFQQATGSALQEK